VVFAADLISKTVVVATLSHRSPIRLLGGLLTLRELRNSGAAFSIGTSMTFLFSLIAVGVIVAILRTARRLRSIPWAITLGLLLGGATGNLGDRLLRSPGPLRGYVVDWIQLPHWPVFNIADSCIVCGGVLAVLLAARGVPIDGVHQTSDAEPSGPEPSRPEASGPEPPLAEPSSSEPSGPERGRGDGSSPHAAEGTGEGGSRPAGTPGPRPRSAALGGTSVPYRTRMPNASGDGST
jgi:signal peptidase II